MLIHSVAPAKAGAPEGEDDVAPAKGGAPAGEGRRRFSPPGIPASAGMTICATALLVTPAKAGVHAGGLVRLGGDMDASLRWHDGEAVPAGEIMP